MQAVKGMRDFYPQEYRQRQWLFDCFRQASLRSGFEFYDASVVEHEELYTRKAGEEISEQLYVFSDKSDRRLALRPEMTPTLARMVAAQSQKLPGRLKWAAIAQCFRYERMTRGRKREHYQWNLDILGDPTPFAELELLTTAIHALESMGLSSNEVRVRVSNRNLMSDVLTGLGVPLDQHGQVFLQVDKLGKIPDSALVQGLVSAGVDENCANTILEIIKSSTIDSVSSLISRLNAPTEGLKQVTELFSLLKSYGMAEYFEFDFSIVRGLAYYTGTVFEFFDVNRGLRAIAGGGRYDGLLHTLSEGAVSMPAVGFGFGDVVIMELLSDLGKLPTTSQSLDYFFAPFGQEERLELLPVMGGLRRKGFAVEMHFQDAKPRKLLELALARGARYCVLMGSEERSRGVAKLRDLLTRDERELSLMELMAIMP